METSAIHQKMNSGRFFEKYSAKSFFILKILPTFASDLKKVRHFMMDDEFKSDSSQILRDLLKKNRFLRK